MRSKLIRGDDDEKHTWNDAAYSLPDGYVISAPPEYTISTYKFELKTDAKFAETFDKFAETSRAVYNRAVAECTLGTYNIYRRAYTQHKPKSGRIYLDKKTYDMAKDMADTLDITVDELRHNIESDLNHTVWYYPYPPDSTKTRNHIGKLLTVWRGNESWLRECPVQYELGAIREAVSASERAIQDNSDYIPFRKKGRITPIYCPSNQAINRKSPHTLHIPGFTIHTKKPIPKQYNDMRSCRIVETTPHNTRNPHDNHSRTFEVHLQIRSKTIQNPPVHIKARAIDTGGKHVVVTADTIRHTTIQTMPHLKILREIDCLKSIRDRKKKGRKSWNKITKRIKTLQKKARRIAGNAINQGVMCILNGIKYLILENIHIKSMTAHGGNKKRGINRTMRRSNAGKFRRVLEEKAKALGITIIYVNAKNTSQECAKCGHISKENRPTRDKFHCTNCKHESQADANAARVILKRGMEPLSSNAIPAGQPAKPVDRAEGQAVLRRRRRERGNKPTPPSLRWHVPCRKIIPARNDFGMSKSYKSWGRQKVTLVEIFS